MENKSVPSTEKQLEKEVAQRTHELELQNKQLEIMARHVEEVTEEKIAFFTNITHEFGHQSL